MGSADDNLLGKGVRIRGRLTGQGGLRVEGEIEGAIQVTGPLVIAEGAVIVGDVSAERVSLEGQLTGDVDAEGPIAVVSGSRVLGDLRGSEVTLEEGASFSGMISASFDLPPGLAESSAPRALGARR